MNQKIHSVCFLLLECKHCQSITITHMMYRFMYPYVNSLKLLNMKYELNRSEESKNTPTEYLKLITYSVHLSLIHI